MTKLNKKLPSNMKSQLFIDFINTVEQESLLIKDKILQKKYLYDVDNMDYERLLEVSSLLTVPFDVSINNSEEFLRNEVKEIPFKIRFQGSVKLFKSMFGVLRRRGLVFLYYYNNTNLVRHSKNLLEKADQALPDKPYVHESEENFTGKIATQAKLDTGWKLDEDPPVKIDNASLKRNTKHFAMEILLDTVFYSGGEGSAPDSGLYPSVGLAPSIYLPPSDSLAPLPRIPYLISPEFFSYIAINMEDSKKVVDVVHIGCQLNALCDNSKFFDSYTSFYTMPDILLNSVALPALDSISSVADMKYIKFGCGVKKNLPSKGGTGSFPDDLIDPIATVDIIDDEKYENIGWYGVCAKYQAFLVNVDKLGVGDGVTNLFSNSASVVPLKKKNIKIQYTTGGLLKTAHDDGYGNIVGDVATGAVNYDTGYITLDTDNEIRISASMGIGDGIQTTFSYVDPIARVVLENSVIITYVVGGTTYVAKDNGSGTITGIGCSGTVVYSNSHIDIIFNPTAPIGNIALVYKYRNISTPDSGTDIELQYYYSNTLDKYITEAGVYDASDNLLAYSTFPRIKFRDFTNHLSFSFVIKKTSF